LDQLLLHHWWCVHRLATSLHLHGQKLLSAHPFERATAATKHAESDRAEHEDKPMGEAHE
jgi:hypothetical protein